MQGMGILARFDLVSGKKNLHGILVIKNWADIPS